MQSSIIVVLLQSTLVYGVPLSFAAVPIILTTGIANGRSREHRLMFWSVAAGAAFVLYALLLDVRLVDAFKSGIGFEAFFVSLIYFPILLRRLTASSNLHLWLPQTVIVCFFLLELAQLLSLKELGLVSWRLSAEQLISTKVFIDDRPSGIFGEPSWFGLSLAALFRLTLIRKSYRKTSAALVGVVILLSGSSLGLIAWACTLGPVISAAFAVGHGERQRRYALFTAMALVFFMSIAVVAAVFYFSNSDAGLLVLQKIGDPFGYASGVSRYVAPVYFVGETLNASPILGMGMHYMPDYLTGRTGAAVLPLNVIIELGIAGLAFYGIIIAVQVLHYKTQFSDLLLCAILLGGLGLQYTAFQGALLAIPIAARSLERIYSRRGNSDGAAS